MFKNQIDYIAPFTEQLANKILLPNGRFMPGYDKTLVMTAVALFHNRLQNLRISSVGACPVPDLAKSKSMIGSLINKDPQTISFIWLEHYVADEISPLILPDGEYVELSEHEDYLCEKLGQRIHIRVAPEWNAVLFFVPHITMELFHAVQVFMPLYFPRLFEEHPRTKLETDLLASLTRKTDTEYRRKMEEILEGESIRRFLLKAQLAGFEKAIRQTKLKGALSKLNDLEGKMYDALEQYRKCCDMKEEQALIVEGLTSQVDNAEENTEFEEYLCENKSLTDIHVEDGHIRFIVKTYLLPYLPDSWDCMSKNGAIFRSYVCYGTNIDDPENLKLLLDAIFSRDHTLKLRMCAYFDLNYNGSYVCSSRQYNYVAVNPSLANYIPNPHLNKHDCFGQNRSDILTQVAEGDMIGAVECCINVAKRVNVDEVNATFRPFIEDLRRFKGKCIVTEDGQELTPVEAIDYLKAKEIHNETDLSD